VRSPLRQRFQHRSLVWLSLVAIALTVFAPVVSQTLAAARLKAQHAAGAVAAAHHVHAHSTPAAPADSAHAAHGHAAEPAPAPAGAAHAGHHHGNAQDGDPFAACGYCELFTHCPVSFTLTPLPPAPAPGAAPLPRLPAVAPPPRRMAVTAAPRGPPPGLRAA